MFLKKRILDFIFLSFLLVVISACGDENSNANKLFIETIKISEEAEESQPFDKRIQLYKKTLKNIEDIKSKYPSSNLAVQLSSGQSIGSFSRSNIEKRLAEVESHIMRRNRAKRGGNLCNHMI